MKNPFIFLIPAAGISYYTYSISQNHLRYDEYSQIDKLFTVVIIHPKDYTKYREKFENQGFRVVEAGKSYFLAKNKIFVGGWVDNPLGNLENFPFMNNPTWNYKDFMVHMHENGHLYLIGKTAKDTENAVKTFFGEKIDESTSTNVESFGITYQGNGVYKYRVFNAIDSSYIGEYTYEVNSKDDLDKLNSAWKSRNVRLELISITEKEKEVIIDTDNSKLISRWSVDTEKIDITYQVFNKSNVNITSSYVYVDSTVSYEDLGSGKQELVQKFTARSKESWNNFIAYFTNLNVKIVVKNINVYNKTSTNTVYNENDLYNLYLKAKEIAPQTTKKVAWIKVIFYDKTEKREVEYRLGVMPNNSFNDIKNLMNMHLKNSNLEFRRFNDIEYELYVPPTFNYDEQRLYELYKIALEKAKSSKKNMAWIEVIMYDKIDKKEDNYEIAVRNTSTFEDVKKQLEDYILNWGVEFRRFTGNIKT